MRSSIVALVAIPWIVALAAPAGGQLLVHKDLPVATAMTIAATALETCAARRHRVSVTVVGRNGEVLVQLRGDNSAPHTVENSFRRAYTARTFGVPSGDVEKRWRANPQFSSVFLTNVIAAQGALPILAGNEVIGAAGVSGVVTTPQAPGGAGDEACAKAGIDKVTDQLK